MSFPPLREAARAVVVDADQRVLLLRYDENGGFWATPGGSLEPGEDYPTAALRELGEELGAKDVVLSGEIAERRQNHPVGGRIVRQIEKYFLIRTSPVALDADRATQKDNIRESRWWPLNELRSTAETVYPLGLADLVADVLTKGLPREPALLR
ncbi:NUDIX hydrolase [Streptomyces sp. NPDC002514]|uniref:NUDIX hydrolase n=1 Tax=Streptomyces sp. NPDC001270 TaxID=3364554 RepID=UPI0036888546